MGIRSRSKKRRERGTQNKDVKIKESTGVNIDKQNDFRPLFTSTIEGNITPQSTRASNSTSVPLTKSNPARRSYVEVLTSSEPNKRSSAECIITHSDEGDGKEIGTVVSHHGDSTKAENSGQFLNTRTSFFVAKPSINTVIGPLSIYRRCHLVSGLVLYEGSLNQSADPLNPLYVNVSVMSNVEGEQRWFTVCQPDIELCVHHYLHQSKHLIVPRIRYDLVTWYKYAEKRYKFHGSSNWVQFVKPFLHPVLRLLMAWLRYAIPRGYSNGQLLNCIYFLDHFEPRLLIKDSDVGDPRLDVHLVKHLIYVVVNQQTADQLNRSYDNYPEMKTGVADYTINFNFLDKFKANR
ncbi:hypothetical protein SLEP1_g17588 [Rubroshorea leprosula]|uniref:LAGLIDADG homing endonuclease n=1 Tax=Rubroshorea leprosula TaxID=152421 RepID=A0AAV5J5C2_9ROSI|nr:hypothetical protein SLEP1_g17588 [Rubroshorea leprosula]